MPDRVGVSNEAERCEWRDITRPLSPRTPVWPGDHTFQLHQQRFSGQLVSAVSTSCHVGTHIDAPLHLDPQRGGVETIPHSRLIGPAEVLRTEAIDFRITEASLPPGWQPAASRILLRTDSYPLNAPIGHGYAGLGVDLIEALAEAGVELVGIDSPSVDPFMDQQLIAHHAMVEHDMTWIEGLWLADIEPGLYDLVALPMALVGADAAPLRAFLRPHS